MTTLKLDRHTYTGSAICEIWRDDKLVGTIYPSARGVAIVSKLFDTRTPVPWVAEFAPGEPPKLVVNILPDPNA